MNNYYPGQAKLAESASSVACRRLINGHFAKSEAKVVIEKELSIFINGEHLVTASIAPIMEREFIIGEKRKHKSESQILSSRCS